MGQFFSPEKGPGKSLFCLSKLVTEHVIYIYVHVLNNVGVDLFSDPF